LILFKLFKIKAVTRW